MTEVHAIDCDMDEDCTCGAQWAPTPPDPYESAPAAPYRPRRSKHTPAAQGSKWIRPSTRWAIYHRDNFACVYCTRVGSLSLDHVGAVEVHGRDNGAHNLVTSCVSCNSSKQGISTRAWFAKLRTKGIDTTLVRRRIAAARAKPIDRVRGAFLAHGDDAALPAAEAFTGAEAVTILRRAGLLSEAAE